MLNKTIKAAVGICAVSLFLSACSSTSTTDPNSAGVDASDSSVTTSGSGISSVTSAEDAAPSETVFYFDFDSSVLRPESRALLNAHAKALKANPRSVRLEGHADERGTREYNIALGERRAQSVRAYLLAQGVVSSIEVVSYGEEYPAVDASNEYAWQQNRRVEIK
ncbi:peptidoglycan-associated lipoprotein [Candidatus Endobugula sertula]|uniref:Peptidoglycan-associated lipoprotein n=1 Tax=Candidatus Endobugula sertula TaxID=62101 RepID=A0A1D2QLZ8_9GAMM|nr:peptidoglycan-associated lipoprotein [Candidatus Endobugula sertula]